MRVAKMNLLGLGRQQSEWRGNYTASDPGRRADMQHSTAPPLPGCCEVTGTPAGLLLSILIHLIPDCIFRANLLVEPPNDSVNCNVISGASHYWLAKMLISLTDRLTGCMSDWYTDIINCSGGYWINQAEQVHEWLNSFTARWPA
jgi:hypothetical protein